MAEVLKTLLFLNVQGTVFVLLLILLKSVIHKLFSGRAQRNLWIFAAVTFLLPVWILVPNDITPPIIVPYYEDGNFVYEAIEDIEKHPDRDLAATPDNAFEQHNLLPWIWGIGMCIFLFLNIGSYIAFIVKKRKDSIELSDTRFSDALAQSGVRKKISLRQCSDADSPMLTGVLFPQVYVPRAEFDDTEIKHIYLHELTHYKHRDLPIKWLVCIINAINWFNPCMYLAMKNLNEACEIYCDEAVTEDMNDDEKRAYMNTILNLVAKKG